MKTSAILTSAAIVAAGAYMSARTLNVNTGNVSYSFQDSQTGKMEFNAGKTLTIQGFTFDIDKIGEIAVTETDYTDNVVTVTYSTSGANVTIAGNIANYVTAEINGAHVALTQSAETGDDTCGEITYILQGESSDGSFLLTGDYKASVELHGLTLTNPSGAAIDIQNGKRIAIRVQEKTVNTLADGAGGSQKAALYCKGHLEFKQKGTLYVSGNKSHAIAAKEYIEVKNTNIYVTSAKKDGINCNQYFKMESGEIHISGTADDGIQVAYKDDADREPEDTGTATILNGKLDITVTADAAKAIKADGDFVMTGGEITATVTGGGIWDADKVKTKAAACIGADGNATISGGTLYLTATGGGGKGISVDGNFTSEGGKYQIYTQGGLMAYVNGAINNNYTGNADNIKSDYKSSPKGIKVDGDILINDGEFLIETKGNGGEGLESKSTITIAGGSVTIHAYEDGMNASNAIYLKGGTIEVTTGTGDAVDSNGPIYVSGGRIVVIGAGGSEQGFDAGDGYKIYINGGTILAAGGGNSAPSGGDSKQAYVTLTQAVNAGETVTISDGTTTLASFVIPAKYGTASTATPSPARAPGGGNWGWGWGGSSGSALLISTPEMISGKTYTIKAGTASTTSTAKLTGGSTGPGK